MDKTAKLRELLLSFMKIGLLTFGGGYVMVPLIQREVIERRGWIKSDEFVALLSIAQSIPGPIALNSSAFVGYKTRGYVGAMTAIFGVVLPSFVILLLVAVFFSAIRENEIVEAAFRGMRPAVVALMAVPMFSLMRGVHPVMIGLSVAAMFAMWWWGLSPVYFILAAIVCAALWGYKLRGGLRQ